MGKMKKVAAPAKGLLSSVATGLASVLQAICKAAVRQSREAAFQARL